MAKANTGTTVKKVLLRIKRYWFFLILSILMAAVTVASSLYVPILIGNAIDYIIGPQNVEFKAITAILSEVGIVIAITALSQWIMNICNNKITYHVTRDIRDEAIEKIEVLPLKYIDGHSYGEVVSRVIADVDQFADGLHRRVNRFPATLWRENRDTSSKPPRFIRHRRRFGGFLKMPLETDGFKTSFTLKSFVRYGT